MDILKEAGCGKVFIGIRDGFRGHAKKDTKEQRLGENLRGVLEGLAAKGFDAVCSFMCEFPMRRPTSLNRPCGFARVFCRLKGVQFQLNPLIILPGTEMYAKYKTGLCFDPERENANMTRVALSRRTRWR